MSLWGRTPHPTLNHCSQRVDMADWALSRFLPSPFIHGACVRLCPQELF